MKLRHPALLKTASWLGTVVARGLVRSLRLEYKALEQPVVMPPQSEPEPRMLYMLWHETLLVPLTHYAEESKVPAFKSIPVRLRMTAAPSAHDLQTPAPRLPSRSTT